MKEARASCNSVPTQADKSGKWIVSWGCSLQLTEKQNNPPKPFLAGNTLRQCFRISAGGTNFKLQLSNFYSKHKAVIKKVSVSLSREKSAIDVSSARQVFFDGKAEITIAPGREILSDVFDFALPARSLMAVSIYFGEISSGNVTGHPGSRTVSYIKKGDCVSDPVFTASDEDDCNYAETEHWYVLSALQVLAGENAATIVTAGDSLTDGRGSDTNMNNRWPDILVDRLCSTKGFEHIGVFNAGVGGNAVINGGLGPTLMQRFRRDVLEQENVKWVIILEGVNDIGPMCGKGIEKAHAVAEKLIHAFSNLILSAKDNDIVMYGSTLTPFGESFYYSPETESARQMLNTWIRNEAEFDAVIDMDKALADPEHPLKLRPEADSGDHLHLSPAGYRIMGEYVDLALFRQQEHRQKKN